MINVLLFVIANAIVALNVSLLIRNFFFTSSWSSKLLTFCVLFLAQVLLVELLLGIISRFIFPEILLAHIIILIITYLIIPNKRFAAFNRPDIKFIAESKLLLFTGAFFICFFVVKGVINLVNPPVCADSLQYHLAFPAAWIQNANLVNPLSLFGALRATPELSWVSYYPINGELFFAWLMMPFKSALLADLGEAPFYLIGIVAIYSILRRFSIEKRISFFCALLWALIPNLFKELRNGSQLDVMGAVLFLLILNAVLSLRSGLSWRKILVLGICSGIFIGTKITNIVWILTLFPLLVYYLFRPNLVRLSIKFGYILAICACVFILGGYMYLKNYLYAANPLYPIRFELFGHAIFPGIMDSSVFKSLYSHNLGNVMCAKLFKEGLGFQFILFIFPSLFLPFVFVPFIARKLKPFTEYVLLSILPVLMIMAYCFILDAGVVRFVFPCLGVGLISAVIFLDKVSWGKGYIIAAGVLSVIAAVFELAHRAELIVAFILSLALFLVAVYFGRRFARIYSRANFFRVMAGVTIAGIIGLYFVNDLYNREEFNRYAAVLSKKEAWQKDIALGWGWLNEATGSGARIAYVGRSEIYPLFGSRLKNKVFYVPINSKPVSIYKIGDGFYRRDRDYRRWLENLDSFKIDFLYIALPQAINNESTDTKVFPIEDSWANGNMNKFRLVFSNSLVHIYRIIH